MSISNDAGHYFQTSSSLETSKRKAAKASNKFGKPVALPSKVLAVLADPSDEGAVYVAEAAGCVKRVKLDTDEVQTIYTRGTAPFTCLALCPATNTLFAGSWDKHIHAISLAPKTNNINSSSSPRLLSGHTDFVKCLLATTLPNNHPILISGGADASIQIWDIATGTRLHKLTTPAKSIQALAIDPESLPSDNNSPTTDSLTLFAATNAREIRRYHLSPTSFHELPSPPILAHETSIYALHFPSTTTTGDSSSDLWTASADKTALRLIRHHDNDNNDDCWTPDTTLPHPDFVRDVVVASAAGVAVTACRDEEVRVWDLATGELLCTYSGHWEEVTGLALAVVGEGGRQVVVSGSIDGTVRRWGLGRRDMEAYREEVRREAEGDGEGEAERKEGLLTAEEEAELAELMGDDD